MANNRSDARKSSHENGASSSDSGGSADLDAHAVPVESTTLEHPQTPPQQERDTTPHEMPAEDTAAFGIPAIGASPPPETADTCARGVLHRGQNGSAARPCGMGQGNAKNSRPESATLSAGRRSTRRHGQASIKAIAADTAGGDAGSTADMSSSPPQPAAVAHAAQRRPRVDVVFNPVSGNGDADVARAALQTVLARGYTSVRFHETTPEKGAGELARDAVRDGARVVVASGGDGTVTAVVQAVRDAHHHTDARPSKDEQENEGDEDVRIGIAPRGTANALCAALGIPAELDAAAALINRAAARLVDVAVVNGDSAMLLLCGIGLEAEAVKRADRRFKNSFGVFAYVLAGISSMRRQKHFTVNATLYDVQDTTLFAGGARVESDVMHIRGMKVKAVTIANAAPPASVLAQGIGDVRCDDGLLEFVVVSSGGMASLFRAMFDLFRSALLRKRTLRSDVFGLRARRIEVTCDPPQRIVIDGEEAGYTPVTIDLDPDASKRQIAVIAPKASIINRRKRRLMRTLTRLWRNLRGMAVLGIAVQTLRIGKGRRTDKVAG
jgi:diacylglycerol kinase family enzyme